MEVASLKPITVALVSPGDVPRERRLAEQAIKKLETRALKHGFVFVLKKWEDLPAGFHPDGPQAEIDKHIDPAQCDLVIGVWWKRYGVVEVAPYSRTAQELNKAVQQRLSSGIRPDVKVYVSRRRFQSTPENVSDHQLVLTFLSELVNKGLLYKEYTDHADFAMDVYNDLSYFLDDTIAREGTTQPLSCSAIGVPVVARSEGFTELVGDIRLAIHRKPGFRSDIHGFDLEVSILTNTNITNRLDDMENTDIELIPEWGFHRIACGRLSASNRVVFTGVRLKAEDVLGTFVIRGIRANAVGIAVSATFTTSYILGTIEVEMFASSGARQTTLRQNVTLAIVQKSIWPRVGGVTADHLHIPPMRRRGLEIRLATIDFQGLFLGSFKSKEQEGANSYGSLLVMSGTNIPPDWQVFVTYSDLLSPTSAVAISTDHNGAPSGAKSEFAKFKWDARIPMIPTTTDSDSFLTSWQVVDPLAAFKLKELRFGIAVIGRNAASLSFWGIRIAIGRSPFYINKAASQPGATLPMPRFIPPMSAQSVPWI